MKPLCILIHLILTSTVVFAQDTVGVQQRKLDSLRFLIKAHPEADTTRVQLLTDYAQLCFSDLDFLNGLKAADEARSISKDKNYIKGEGLYLKSMAIFNHKINLVNNLDIYYELEEATKGYERKRRSSNFSANRLQVFYELEGNRILHQYTNFDLFGNIEMPHSGRALNIESIISNLEAALSYFTKLDNKEIIANLHNALFHVSNTSNRVKAEEHKKSAQNLFNELGLSYHELTIIMDDIVGFWQAGKDEEARILEIKSVEIYTQISNQHLKALCATLLGRTYSFFNRTNLGLEYLFEAEELLHELGEKDLLKNVYLTIASSYEWILRDPEKAVRYELKEINLRKEIGYDEGIHLSYVLYLESLLSLDRHEEFPEEYRDYLTVDQTERLTWFHADVEWNKARLLQAQAKSKEARLGFQESISIFKKTNDPIGGIWPTIDLAESFRADGDIKNAINQALIAYTWASEAKLIFLQFRAADLLSQLYEQSGDKSKAFDYLKQYRALKDENEKLNNAVRISELEVQSILNRRQREIELLEAESQLKEQENKTQRVLLISIAGALASVVFLSFILVRNNRQKQKTNKVLNSKNKELEIEAALERVRSRSMGMQKSEELKEVINIVYQQLRQLKINVDHAGFVVDYTPYGDWNFWIADEQDIPTKITHPYFESVWANQFNKAKEKGEDLFVTHLNFEEKNKFYNELLSYVPGLPNVSKDFYLNCPGLAATTVLLDNVALYIENFVGKPFKEEDNNTLIRFGKVFQQTYTRFLDLQKSEAQAREARIEASLERVRTQAMAMHKSDDLLNISKVLYEELKMLGIDEIRNAMVLIHDEKNDFFLDYDYSSIGGKITRIPTNGISLVEKYVKELQENEKSKVSFLELIVSGEELESWKKARKATGQLDDPRLDSMEALYYYHYSIGRGNISISTFSTLSNEKLQVLERFRNVFQLPYQRYHDIEIAVAQTEQARLNLIQIQTEKNRAEDALTILKATQTQLIQSEKLASLGELTAGIAHEIQNPLNFVNNFSEVSNELIDEMKAEFKKGDTEEGFVIADDIKQNLEKILHHGKRADAIVKGMLQHSNSSSGVKEPTDINALADEYLRLAYHGFRAKDKSFNAKFETDFDSTLPKLNLVPQDIGRVILNLINNGFYAVNERQKLLASSNELLANFEPTVSISTKKEGNKVLISVKDNGNGIPDSIKEKIFQPFFTTKPTGQGTGLGLSLSYDIVKAHGGEIKVNTKESEGTEFTISLPA